MTCFGAREECSKAATQILKQRVTEIQDPSNRERLPPYPAHHASSAKPAESLILEYSELSNLPMQPCLSFKVSLP